MKKREREVERERKRAVAVDKHHTTSWHIITSQLIIFILYVL